MFLQLIHSKNGKIRYNSLFFILFAVLFILNSEIIPKGVFRLLFLKKMTNIDDVTTTKWVLRPKIDTKLAKNTLNVLQNAILCILYNFSWKKFQILQN